MTEIEAKVTRTSIKTRLSGALTSGMVGVPILFEYESGIWDGLHKTAVFTAGKVIRDVLNADDTVEVPPEVLAKPNEMLSVGVYGTDDAGDLVIPTVMTSVGFILPGTDPSGDESTRPGLPVWAQLQAQINAMGGSSVKITDDGKGNVTITTGGV